ncbi:nucleotidyltransferase family protein [Gilvimarinus xylanilyticus]|uniref:Nucleotidyltransferase family protein n=1 Tax=Gilvimarinus xylanilyticus TaxID=2944139 RepID=A0A9X2HWQ0_9GAMM|nr:nucleotidyltransferase family protein [Gilvimarinus xylanilyticus]MCP8899530.1 nucleotidyltransferase family protein [Gilvimarinus xylanilyticus]
MSLEEQLAAWIEEDSLRMDALFIAAELQLPQWCIAAGFVRNLAWDKLHQHSPLTPLNDVDLIFFDPQDTREGRDIAIESHLSGVSRLPWSVKNQARMHARNGDKPYNSTEHAMSFWVEVETAVGVRLQPDQSIELVAPFGVSSNFDYTVTINAKRPKPAEFFARIRDK